MWSLDSVVGTRSLLKQFPILASDWSVRAQLSFSLVTVYHQLSQLIQPARIWDMGTSNYMRQIATMLNCSCERSNGIFSWVVVFCKYCFLKSVSVIDLRYWKQTQLAIVRKRSESDRESGTYFLDRIGPGYCCIQKDHGAWKIWKVSSYFWPRLTDSGLPRSSDTWRGLSLVHFVSEHWDSYWPPWHVPSETWERSSEHSDIFNALQEKSGISIRSLISPSPPWAAWMNVTCYHWITPGTITASYHTKFEPKALYSG